MNALYKTVGISKQAVIQYENRQNIFDKNCSDLFLEAEELRREHPGCGVEKMYFTLKPAFIGRDRCVEMLMESGFRLKHKKNYRRTTYSSSVYYPNLIQGMNVFSPQTIWQSDITYIEVGNRFYYAVFIIDVYTKLIVGHQVSDNMRATANMKALEMGVMNFGYPEYHHSDRGAQYIYKKYIEKLEQNQVKISMALSAQDNAYAERINQTIKNEYLYYWKPKNYIELQRMVKKAVFNYNNKRVHNNLKMMTPIEFYTKWKGNLIEKPTITIFDYREIQKKGIHTD